MSLLGFEEYRQACLEGRGVEALREAQEEAKHSVEEIQNDINSIPTDEPLPEPEMSGVYAKAYWDLMKSYQRPSVIDTPPIIVPESIELHPTDISRIDLSADLALRKLDEATEEDLCGVKGIGSKTAQKIIANRPFYRWEDVRLHVSQPVYANIKAWLGIK